MTDTLFPLQEANEPHVEGVNAEPRVQRPNRTQLAWRPVDLEALLPADHRERVVWEFVEGLELGPLYGAIKAVEGHAGRAPIDPAIWRIVRSEDFPAGEKDSHATRYTVYERRHGGQDDDKGSLQS